MAESVQFNNTKERRLKLGDNELARRTLAANEIDFSRKDVHVKTASNHDRTVGDHELLEIDLGPVQSLQKNSQRRDELHGELRGGIMKDQDVIDQFTGRGTQYKLVLVGREIAAEEEQYVHGARSLVDAVSDPESSLPSH